MTAAPALWVFCDAGQVTLHSYASLSVCRKEVMRLACFVKFLDLS